MVRSDAVGRVFVSYVREDKERVDQLCSLLTRGGIPYWRDRNDLAPGDAWKAEIRKAIREGSAVFLACFSDNSHARTKSHMNEEITVAVEEYRKMPPGATWLIPVRFDEVQIPEWDLGAGRVLGDLNYVTLFGDDHTDEVVALLTTVQRTLGRPASSADALQASVAEAEGVDRVVALRRMTEELIVDPARRIELGDAVTGEAARIRREAGDDVQFPTRFTQPDERARLLQLAEVARRYLTLAQPLCASLHVSTRWARDEDPSPWVAGVRACGRLATASGGGNTALLSCRHIPLLSSIFTVAVTAAASGRWHRFRSLLLDPSIRSERYSAPLPPLLLTSPYDPLSEATRAADVLAHTSDATNESSDEEVLDDLLEGRVGRHHTPMVDWLFAGLRAHFGSQIPDDDDYADAWDRAEVMLGVLAEDAALQHHAATGAQFRQVRPRWVGRSTWRSRHAAESPLDRVSAEITRDGNGWPPLQAGCLGGDVGRAQTAVEVYRETFDHVRSSRSW